MADIISHLGIVENINDDHIQVKIIQTSACSSCSAKNHCYSADNKEKIIDIYESGSSYKIGEKVEVIGETSMGFTAVTLAYIIPFVILILSLFLAMYLTHNNDLVSVLVAFGAMAVYYIILAFNRDKVKKNFSFKLKHINS